MAWEQLTNIWKRQKDEVIKGEREDLNICLIDDTPYKINPRTQQKACDYGHIAGV